ncbi:stage II sporulation protein D [Clostridium sp.]|uniref:stage II sporulation protein D n=1 Tax=Clostridium sp. TaxID=1506 RepID=UPI002A916848|nr:stage II sporulation protein D [Clostridium sp.]MDY6013289.1 stage II sporulation protein D [Clostridium sp.]
MREREIIESIKKIGLITGFILIFTLIIPFILMGSSIKNFISPTEEISSEKKIDIAMEGENKVKVYMTSEKKVKKIDVEEYILGVVSSEMPATFEEEALKAQAIAARTFYYSKRMKNCNLASGGEICDSIHCQVYMDKEERLKKWPKEDRDKYYEKVKKAVEDTKGQVLTYDNEIVLYPQFFSTSSGKTENAEDVFSSKVPYLKSVSSEGEEVSASYESEKEVTNKDFAAIVNSKYNKANLSSSNISKKVQIKSRTDGGSVKEIQLGGTIIKGTEFRSLFDLKSANFTLEYSQNKVKIKCKGNGHGVGMSQWGANLMAKEGKGYEEILKHYYTGVELGKIIYK